MNCCSVKQKDDVATVAVRVQAVRFVEVLCLHFSNDSDPRPDELASLPRSR